MSICFVLIAMACFLYFTNNCETINQIMEVLYVGTREGNFSVLTILVHFFVYFCVILQMDRLLGKQRNMYVMLRCRVKNSKVLLKIQGCELLKSIVLVLGGRLLADHFFMFIFDKNIWCLKYVWMILFFTSVLIFISAIGIFMNYYVRTIPFTNLLGCIVLLMCFIHILLNDWINVHFYSVIGFEIISLVVCAGVVVMRLKNKITEIERI